MWIVLLSTQLRNDLKGCYLFTFPRKLWISFFRFNGNSTMLLLVLTLMTQAAYAQIIGGNSTTLLFGTAVLPCKLNTEEKLAQISWQRVTKEKPRTDNFFTITANGPQYVNGHDYRFKFIGNFADKNGTLQLSEVRLTDEGTYTCIVAAHPGGNRETKVHLQVLVPPTTSLEDFKLTLGNDEAVLASCIAADAKPPAEVKWLTGTLGEKVKVNTDSTLYDNGTTTTVSLLLGVPSRELSNQSVQCVVTSPALEKEVTLPFTIQIQAPPLAPKITERTANVFECQIEAYPPADFTWTRADQSWPQPGVRVDGATLQFLSTTSELNGLYLCNASNSYGSELGYLYVRYTSGSCTAPWTLFGLLLALNAAAALFYLYRTGKLKSYILGREGDTHGEMQEVPTSSD